jgi:ABC-type antimicrobial peptide transport system permease subunit
MYQSTLDSAESSLAQSQATATQEIIIAIAATSLIVLFVMLYTVRERTKEIGTLKAIGFSSGTIMNQFVLEGTLLSLIAGAVGIAIGFVAAPFLSSLLLPSINLFNGAGRFSNSGGTFIQPIQGDAGGPATFTLPNATSTTIAQIDPTLMLIAFGIAILLGVLGSLYPAWRAARIRPAEAMRYE